jgi:predicted LPLAT superfamily acyltransferase
MIRHCARSVKDHTRFVERERKTVREYLSRLRRRTKPKHALRATARDQVTSARHDVTRLAHVCGTSSTRTKKWDATFP